MNKKNHYNKEKNMNNTVNTEFMKICKMEQKELKNHVYNKLINEFGKSNVYLDKSKSGFVFAQGELPILLVAHLDTVHKETPRNFMYNAQQKSLSASQGIGGDDRCGVYMILDIIKTHRCSVLFCEDEETGGNGAETFIKQMPLLEAKFGTLTNYMYLMEFDRANAKDAVFYDCDNDEFEKFITKNYYKTAYGTFSDISLIAPILGIAAVNLSCGYYKAHTTNEYVVIPEMLKSIDEAKKIIDRTEIDHQFVYIPAPPYYNDLVNTSYPDFAKWDKYGYYYDEPEQLIFTIVYNEDTYDAVYAVSEEEAVGKSLMSHPNKCYNDIFEVIVDDYDYKDVNKM